MLIIIFLINSLLLQLAKSCISEGDSSLNQTEVIIDDCKCREYHRVYATCYFVYTCLKFPRNFRTPYQCFVLQGSGIKQILAGDFANLTHLTGMNIDTNTELKTIQAGVFKDMKNLINLSISYNPNLKRLDEHVFKGLDNLETLHLSRNGFVNFEDFSACLKAAYMPKLKTIILNELNCPKVDKDDFIYLNGSQVKLITFDYSQIEFIHRNALAPLKHLQNLSVSETLLKRDNLIDILKKSAEDNITLKSLSLKGWGFKGKVPADLFDVIDNIGIKELFLDKNLFHIIDEHTFPRMPNIQSLHISENLITDIKENAFVNLPNLKVLHLQLNKLISVPEGALVPTIEFLDVSTNAKLASSYFNIAGNQFANMSSLITLDLSNNNIRKIFNDTFNGLISLKNLYLYHCNIGYIYDGSFTQVTNLEYLDLSQNRFPPNTFGKEIFKGLTKLQYLSLENCKMDHIPSNGLFGYLTSLKSLNLNQNHLLEINPQLIISLKSLRVLNVADNKLKGWLQRLFKDSNMENLTISYNTFTHFTPAMLADFSEMKMIDISNNPFYCTCDDLVESLNILTKTKIDYILSFLNDTTYCLLPEEDDDITVARYYQNNYEICKRDQIAKLMNYLVPSSVCGVLILSITVLSYIYRWHIRYWIFLTKMAISKRTQFKKRENVKGHTNYLYDAFVSYSTDDRNFVIRLVSMLEGNSPFVKLCVYERDFVIGTIISESVLVCLARSRKTLLVISNAYIKSQWCTWEAQVAENHRLFFGNEHGDCVNDSLILIKLGNISNRNISPMLRYLMKTRVYLEWEPDKSKQMHFWEKLRNVLAPALSSTEENINV